MPVRYNRAPSGNFLELFQKDGLLSALVNPLSMDRHGLHIDLDLQFREDNKAALYCGLTHVVELKLKSGVDVFAHEHYLGQPCSSKLMRIWAIDETPTTFRTELTEYLKAVEVHADDITKEGVVQARWTCKGAHDLAPLPWLPFDREARLGYDETESRIETRDHELHQEAISTINALPDRLQEPKSNKKSGANKIDIIALDDAARLVLVEAKHREQQATSHRCRCSAIWLSGKLP